MADLEARLQALSEEYNKLQQELQTTVSSHQQLEAQKAENDGVKKEFDNLDDDEAIYKLIGPVLLKQDKVEAESTVDGRLDFIAKEIARLDGQIKEDQGKMEKVKGEIIQIQAGAQADAGAAPGAQGGGAGKTSMKAIS